MIRRFHDRPRAPMQCDHRSAMRRPAGRSRLQSPIVRRYSGSVIAVASLLLLLFVVGNQTLGQTATFSGETILDMGTPSGGDSGNRQLYRDGPYRYETRSTPLGDDPFGGGQGDKYGPRLVPGGFDLGLPGTGFVELENGDAWHSTAEGNIYQMWDVAFDTTAGSEFTISQLYYYNEVTFQGSNYTILPIDLTVDFNDPTVNNISFDFLFDLNITLNSGGGVPDTLTPRNLVSSETFQYQGQRYTLELLGFQDPTTGNLTNSFSLPENEWVQSNLRARFTEVENDSNLVAPDLIEFGRRMKNTTPNSRDDLIPSQFSITKTGIDATNVVIATDSDGILVTPGQTAVGTGSHSIDGTVELQANVDGTGTTGEREWIFLTENRPDLEDSPITQTATEVTATIVDDRLINSEQVDFGRVMVGREATQTGLLRTFGSDAHNTRVTVNGVTVQEGDATVDLRDGALFNDGSVTSDYDLTTSFNQAGVNGGSLTLTEANGALTPEGLEGEDLNDVNITYQATAVDNRQIAGAADFGRVIVNVQNTTDATLTSNGLDDFNTRVVVDSGQYTDGTATLDIPDNPDTQAPGGPGYRFSGREGESSLTSGLTATFDTIGAASGAVTLTEGSGLTGEGLLGENVQDAPVAYTAQVIDNRQLTGENLNLGKTFTGTAGTMSKDATITSAGSRDQFTDLTVNQGTYSQGDAVLEYAETTTLNGTATSATGSLAVTNAFATAGTSSSAFQVNENNALQGEGLNGETVTNVDLGYEYTVVDRGNVSFDYQSDLESLLLDFGTFDIGSGQRQRNFGLTNLESTLGFTQGLVFDGIIDESGNTNVFDLSDMTTSLSSLAAGDTETFGALLNTATSGNFAAQYTLAFSDDMSDITLGNAQQQTITLTLTGIVESGQVQQPDPITILNESFESVRPDSATPTQIDLAPGELTGGMRFTRTSSGRDAYVSVWESEGLQPDTDFRSGVLKPGAALFNDAIPDGENIAHIGFAGTGVEEFWQQAVNPDPDAAGQPGTFAEDWDYLLSFDVGNGIGTTFSQADVDILIETATGMVELMPTLTEGTTPAAGQWESFKQYYRLSAGSGLAGLPVWVRVANLGGGTTFFDNFFLGFADPDTGGGLIGDFDGDGTLTSGDIDALRVIANNDPNTVPPLDEKYDLDGSETVDHNDIIYWVEVLFGTLMGDADLDGDVDLADLGILAGNFNQVGTFGWADGNFDLDDDVDLSDLGTLAGNFGLSVDGLMVESMTFAQALAATNFDNADLPEPGSLAILLAIGPMVLRRSRSVSIRKQ